MVSPLLPNFRTRRTSQPKEETSDLGHLLHALIEEGKRVAAAVGVKLHEDPWEMNKIGAMTNHPPSMLHDIRHRQPTEVDFLGGAIAREAARVGEPAPLHTAIYRLIKAKKTAGLQRRKQASRSSAGIHAGKDMKKCSAGDSPAVPRATCPRN